MSGTKCQDGTTDSSAEPIRKVTARLRERTVLVRKQRMAQQTTAAAVVPRLANAK